MKRIWEVLCIGIFALLCTACGSDHLIGSVTLTSDTTERVEGDDSISQEENGTETEVESGVAAGVTAGVAANIDAGTISDAETGESAEPLVQTLTITATGDCTLAKAQVHGYSGSFVEYYDNYGEKYFFQNVRDIFEADDFTIINLECVLSESTDGEEKTYRFEGKPSYVGILTSSSVEAASLGNNHNMDYGWQSLWDTQSVLDTAGIVYGLNDHVGIYTADNVLTIGIVSTSMLSMSAEREAYIQDGIAQLREAGVDLVVACCHWGLERNYYPTDYQTTTAHKIIDWGADVVIGNHPHVLQGIEVYNGKVICYSLGNFCFGGNLNPADKDTAIYQQTFTFVDGVLQEDIDARIIPCTISSHSGYNDFQPAVASGDAKARIIGNMNTYSAPYSKVSFDEEGQLLTE